VASESGALSECRRDQPLFDRVERRTPLDGYQGRDLFVWRRRDGDSYNARPDTDDVDAVFEPVRQVRRAARLVAERNGLPIGWLNDAVEIFLARHERRILLDLSHLKIYVPPPDYLLAMKVLSARADTMDQDDLKVLIRKLGLKSAAEVFGIVKGYYPRQEIKPETRILIEELLDTRDNG